MFARTIAGITLGLSVLLLSGCAVNKATASLSPGADLSRVKTVYVVKQPKDGRNIDDMIKVNLEKRGYVVSKGPQLQGPYAADAAITYVDKWTWDVTMYMIELTIQVRDPKDGFPLATGNSMHTSITRKSPPEMVDEVLANILTAPKK